MFISWKQAKEASALGTFSSWLHTVTSCICSGPCAYYQQCLASAKQQAKGFGQNLEGLNWGQCFVRVCSCTGRNTRTTHHIMVLPSSTSTLCDCWDAAPGKWKILTVVTL